MSVDAIAGALVCVSNDDVDGARDRLSAVANDPLAAALIVALSAGSSHEVYVDPDAFTRFIDGPPNARLYCDVEHALRDWISADPDGVRWVVDIGCGDGRVTEAVVPATVDRIELVEPSDALMDSAVGRLGGRVDAHRMDVQAWVDSPDVSGRDAGWATFALHNLSPVDRSEVLGGIAQRVTRFAVAEFDVPVPRSVEDHAVYCAERYSLGAAAHDDPVVLSGFLVPVLLGQFAPNARRHTYEQPHEAWAAELLEAGFDDTDVTVVHSDFWWGPAGLVTGRTSG